MFQFKPLSYEYFKILFEWLQCSHVKQWWGPSENWEDFYLRHQKMIVSPLVFPHIVVLEGEAIGYINYWFVEEDDDFKSIYPPSTVGTDQFIGKRELIGKGLGSAYVRQFTNELLRRSDISLVITDPDPSNIAAIRCYEKAGFKKTILKQSAKGDVQLLEKLKETCEK